MYFSIFSFPSPALLPSLSFPFPSPFSSSLSLPSLSFFPPPPSPLPLPLPLPLLPSSLQLPKDKLQSSDLSLPFYSPSTYTFRAEDPPLPSFPSIDVTPALHHSSTSSSFTASINPLDLPLYTSPQQPPSNNPRSHQTHPFLTSRLSHPPPVTSSPYPISSLTPDQFQRPVQMLNSLHSSSSFLPPPSQPSLPSFSSASLPPFSTIPHGPQSNFSNIEGGPLAVSSNYSLSAPQSRPDLKNNGAGTPPVISSKDGAFKSVVKVESGGNGGRRRMSSSSGPPLDDQGQLGSGIIFYTCIHMIGEQTRQTVDMQLFWAGWPLDI